LPRRDARRDNRDAEGSRDVGQLSPAKSVTVTDLESPNLSDLESRNFRALDLPVSGLYLLAKPNTPEEAREAVIERAQNGEALTSTHAVADAGFAHLAEGDFLRVGHDEMVKPGFICTTFLGSTQLSTRSAQCCINFVRGPISARGPCRL
jgi:hypothetical protein